MRRPVSSMAWSPSSTGRPYLNGGRQWNRRRWRWLARAPEAVAGRSEAQPLPTSVEPPKVARRGLRRRRSRARALPRRHSDHATILLGDLRGGLHLVVK